MSGLILRTISTALSLDLYSDGVELCCDCCIIVLARYCVVIAQTPPVSLLSCLLKDTSEGSVHSYIIVVLP